MLKDRIITGILLAIAGYYFTIIAPLNIFIFIGSFLLLLITREWCKLVGFDSLIKQFLMLLGIILSLAILSVLPIWLFDFLVVGWWLFALYWVITYQRQTVLWPSSSLVRGLLGIALIAPLFYSAYKLKQFDDMYKVHSLFFVVVVIAMTDMMAYFVGKTIGNHLLISRVSPKKTWEGIVGGVFASSVLSVPMAYWCSLSDTLNPWMAIPALFIAASSVLGDLTESVCKRNAGLKDSGNLFPGHGGLLDRFDSYTAGVPIAYLFLQFVR